MTLDFVMGFGGLWSFCQGAFFGIAAYTNAILITRLGITSFWVSAPAGILVAGLAACLFGFLALRVSAIYFLIITFALGQLLYSVVLKWKTVTGGTDGQWEGDVDLWLNTGNDASGKAQFMNAGVIGGAGTDARGLDLGQLNPDVDSYRDVLFGNYEGQLYGLFADLTDTDGDGIIDDFDNAPLHPNAPRLDMNTDGGINRLDQLDNDHDGVGECRADVFGRTR